MYSHLSETDFYYLVKYELFNIWYYKIFHQLSCSISSTELKDIVKSDYMAFTPVNIDDVMKKEKYGSEILLKANSLKECQQLIKETYPEEIL